MSIHQLVQRIQRRQAELALDLEARRSWAIRQVLHAGRSQQDVALDAKVSKACVCQWVKDARAAPERD